MKELIIEQKAKRYDEAIKIAKSKIKNDKDHILYEDDITEMFPELKESEDKRIRDLKRLNVDNPYPSSKDPSTGDKIEPTADGLRF